MSASPELVTAARRQYADRNPESRAAYDRARQVLPGGHTRTVLTHPPFPLTFVAGEGAELVDADGHRYIDLLGDYTAGLLGHSEHRVLDAVSAALRVNASVGGVHPAEARLAGTMCARFGLDRVRFTNSGTEANLMALTTAIAATGRTTVLAFRGGYHGGVLSYVAGPSSANAPYDVVLAPYNDIPATRALVEEIGSRLAAVIVEPMLGSGGCLPADAAFLAAVFDAVRAVGGLCIADEVMTSRHGRRGMIDLLGLQADLTSFGKYLGGGFSFGAFGGRAELLDLYDTSPESARPHPLGHAGTFNNNLASMTAGTVVLGEVYTADVAERHLARGDDFRHNVAAVLARHPSPVSVSGFGSMMSLHALDHPPARIDDVALRDGVVQELLFLGLLERGVYIAHRGMMNVGLAHTDDHLAAALDVLDDTLSWLDERLQLRP